MKRTLLKTLVLSTCLLGPVSLAKVPTKAYQYTGFDNQTVAAEIGEFKVPENRENPNSRMIIIKFVKFPSTSKHPKNPIVYLAGGPGGSATGTAKRPRFELFNKLRQVADVILFDQRGTGLSSDLKLCKTDTLDISRPTTKEGLISATIADTKTCVKQWQQQGFDLNGYNTKQNAADLVDLAQALGTDKINLWGISYGSHLAFAVAKYHPQIINQMVLASLEGLDQTVKRPARVQALLEKVDLMLKQDPATAKRYPDLLGTMARVLDKLEQAPQVVKTQDFRQQPITVGIGKLDVQFVMSYILLSDPKHLAKLPRLFAEMDKGNFAEVGAYVAYIKSMASSHNPMSLAMDAASGISTQRWQMVQQEAKKSLVGRTTNFPFPDVNAHLPVKDLGDEFRQEVKSKIPALFLAGTLDGRTLYQSQVELAGNFSNASLITIDGAGHNLYMSHPDVHTSVIDYLNGKPVASKTISLPPLQFQ